MQVIQDHTILNCHLLSMSMPETQKQKIKHLLNTGELEEAEKSCLQLLNQPEPLDDESWLLMAAIQAGLGNLDQVKYYCLKAIDTNPRSAIAYFNLGIAQQSLHENETAVSSYRKAIGFAPSHAGAHTNLGIILQKQEKHAEAVPHLAIASQLQPNNADIHHYLGISYRALADSNKAEIRFRTALRLSPNNPGFSNDLGDLLFTTGHMEDAVSCFLHTIKINPHSFIAHYNLSIAYWRTNKVTAALEHCLHALKISPDNLQVRQSFAQLINSISPRALPNGIWDEVYNTFHFHGVDCDQLINPIIARLRANKLYTKLITSSLSLDFPHFTGVLTRKDNLLLLDDKVLREALSHAVIPDFEIESLLSLTRKAFLHILCDTETTHPVSNDICLANFLPALANQCFLTEYAYYADPGEYGTLARVREIVYNQLSNRREIDTILLNRLMIIASYEPLGLLKPDVFKYLRDNTLLPPKVLEVITRQVDEPEKERNLAQGITSLTAISENISRKVQDQYECSPYPRWVSVTLHKPRPYHEVLGDIFHHADLPVFNSRPLNMLIAGCGSGKHPLQSATRFKDAHVTAIDLSKSSLSYAKRKAQEYGIRNIEFYQADILELGSLQQTYHIIESIGVLHHMNDPAKGLDILVDRLLPGGLFNIGLYSTRARYEITKAREFIRDMGFSATSEGIREARKAIGQLGTTNPIRKVLQMKDFYSLSGCRDLLFHVQEHTFSLPEIDTLINQAGLKFIGFDFINNIVRDQYLHMYPEDRYCTNLKNWDAFEQKHRDTFIGMYIFWCRKA